MNKQIMSLLCGGLLLGATTAARAMLVTVDFSGTIERDCGHMDAGGHCDGLGLGLHAGDPFTGQFTYATDETLSAFFVQFPTQRFDATDLNLEFHPFDGYLTTFGVKGAISDTLFLTIGLTNGEPVRGGGFPTVMDCADWNLCGLQINDLNRIPVEIAWLNPAVVDALNATSNTQPDVFSMRTTATPEPSSFLLLASGLVWLWYCLRRRPCTPLLSPSQKGML